MTILNSTAYRSYTSENHPVGRWYQQTPNKKIEEATTVLTGGRNEKKRKEFWLRGVDLFPSWPLILRKLLIQRPARMPK